MKKLINPAYSSPGVDVVLLIVRMAIAGLMLVHGLPKLMNLISGAPIAFPNVGGMSSELSLGMAVFAEVICSVLILFGLGTRLAVIPLIITMFVAVFHIHGADPFIKKEIGLHYLLTYILLFVMGSGRYSMDSILSGNRRQVYKVATSR